MSSYASGGTSGSTYAQTAKTSSPYAGSSPGSGSGHSGGGLFGFVNDIPGVTAVEHGAHAVTGALGSALDKTAQVTENIGTGVYKMGKDAIAPGNTGNAPFWTVKGWEQLLHPEAAFNRDPLGQDIAQIGKQTVTSLQHPLRDPVQTALTALTLGSLGVGAAARAGYAADALGAAKAADAAGDAQAAAALRADAFKAAASPLHKPPTAMRTLLRPKTVAPEGIGPANLVREPIDLQASGNHLIRAYQAAHDAILQSALDEAAMGGKRGLIAKYADRRIAGALGETTRITKNIRGVPAMTLSHLRGFDKGIDRQTGQLALFLRSANVSAKDAAAFWEKQGAARTAALAKIADRIDKQGLLEENANGDLQVNAAKFPKLAAAEKLMTDVQAQRAAILKEHGLMSPEGMQARLNLVGRKFAGATSGTVGIRPITDDDIGQNVRVNGGTIGKLVDVHNGDATVFYPQYSRSVRVTVPEVETAGKQGLIGGETAKAGQGYTSLRTSEKPIAQTDLAQARGENGVIPKPKKLSVGKRATGSGIESGRIPVGLTRTEQTTTAGVARAAHDALRYQNTVEFRGLVAKYGSDTLQHPGDEILVADPNAATHEAIPENIDVLLGRRNSTIGGATEDERAGLAAAMRARLEEAIPSLNPGSELADLERTAGAGMRAPEGYKWVPRRMLPDEITRVASPRYNLAKFADSVNSAITAATVYLKLGHFPTRGVTNAITNIIQGSAMPGEIAKTVKLVHELNDQEVRELAALTGTHGYEALPHEGQSYLARKVESGSALSASWWAKHVDAPFRINAIAREFRDIGRKTPAQVREALAQLRDPGRHGMNAADASRLDWAVRRANRVSIMYDGLNSVEKRYITRVFWFYPWTKGATRYAFHVAGEHPLKATAIAGVGNLGAQYQQQKLGNVPSYDLGLTPVGHGMTSNFSSLTPFSTVGQMAQLLKSPLNTDTGLPGQLNPAYAALAAIAQGKGLSGAVGQATSPTPEMQALNAAAHPPQAFNAFGATNPFGISDPRAAAAVSELLRALGGASVPRPTSKAVLNKEALHQHEHKHTITTYTP